MTQPQTDIPVRAPAETSADDTVLPFEVAALDLRGRVVRLGPAVDEILTRHDYPPPVAKLLGEAIVLTVLLGSALKIEGRFILQTQTDGPVRMLVVDFTHARPGARLRALRRGARRRPRSQAGKASTPARCSASGHLAMTIDQGADMSRYQGLVALDGGSLEDAAHEYFMRSEQIPTRVRLAVGEEFSPAAAARAIAGAPAACCCSSCRKAPERARVPDLDPGDAPEGTAAMWCRRTTPGSRAAR